MKSKGPSAPAGIALAAALVLMCAAIAFIAIRATAVRVLPPTQSALARIAPHDPERILQAETIAFVLKRGKLGDADYAQIADAARAAPLDARPYVFAAARHLMRDDKQPIIPLLEAGRRLDPRQSWIRLYLLDQYLEHRHYAQAAIEFAVLTRLVSGTGGPIVTELARMSTDPATAGAVRSTLARNPELENGVLIQLAKSGTPPNVILGMASPAARAMAADPGGWGGVLVAALTDKRDYSAARSVWQTVYAVPSAKAAALPYDGELQGLPGSAPFNWTLRADDTGAIDRTNNAMSVTYYGRQLGELADQLLLLAPGRYRLTFALSGPPPSNNGPTLSWTVGCDQREKPPLLDSALPPTSGNARTIALQFSVPANNCPAQWLRLMGDPGQFPGTMTATIQHIALQRIQAEP